MTGDLHMADLTTLLDDDHPVMTVDGPSALVEGLIAARDRLKSVSPSSEARMVARAVMADAANHIAAERKALLDLANLAEDERLRANRLMELLTQAREYVADALDAYRHDDGIELLRAIDAEEKGSTVGRALSSGEPADRASSREELKTLPNQHPTTEGEG